MPDGTPTIKTASALYVELGFALAAVEGYRPEDLAHTHVRVRHQEDMDRLEALAQDFYDAVDAMRSESVFVPLNADDYRYELRVSEALHGSAS